MAPFIHQIIRLLSTPEGILIYSLILGLITFAALTACIYATGKQEPSVSRRMRLGLVLLLLVQLVLFVASSLAWMGIIDGHSYIPPMDRASALISLVLIIWLWAIPKPQPFTDFVAAVVGILVMALGVGGIYFWLVISSNTSFNTSMVGGYAYYIGLGLLAFGWILLLILRPAYWGYGILMLSVMLGGYIGEYFSVQANSDYGWILHLGEMVGFILLLALPARLISLRTQANLVDKGSVSKVVHPAGGAQMIQSVMNLLTETSPQQYYQELTQVVSDIMNADFCLLMLQPKSGEQLIVPVGYNRMDGRMLDGFSAEAAKIPTILDAIKSGKILRSAGSTLNLEIKALSDALGMQQTSQLLMVPFQLQGISAVMSMGVLARASVSTWNDEDAQRLMEIAGILVSNAGKYSKGGNRQADLSEMTQKLQRAEAYADQVRLEYAQLKAKYDSITSQATESAAQVAGMTALAENQRHLQAAVNQLEIRNHELETLLGRGRPSMEEVDQLRQELRSALADLARMPSTLSKSDQRMLEMQLSTVKHLDEVQPTELVTSIAQEFRQPLSTIIGYNDLLLSESVGILGAMQRKFLERMKASTERLGILLNELVQVMSIDGGKVDQTSESVDLRIVIDEAVRSFTAQINEKNITLRLDVPDQLPTVRGNSDTIQQILANLLENACLVTRLDGVIRLAASVEHKEDIPAFILISVMDQGGGIEKNDLPRVFMRRYKMENPMIQGIGDTGVGLSIVKSLVDLYKGRVWVDTKEGVGSTFSVLLPLAQELPNPSNQTIPTG